MPRILLLICCALTLMACQPKTKEFQAITTDAVYNADLSQDAQLLLISTANTGLQLWDLKQKSPRYNWNHGQENQANDVIDVAISPNNQFAASMTKDSLVIWQINDGQAVGWWSLPATARSITTADNGHTLVGLSNGSVMSLSVVQNKLIEFLGHQEKINSVAINAAGTLALSGGNDGKVILWETQTGQPLQEWQLDSRITKVLLNNAGTRSFASDITGNANIWQSGDGKKISSLDIKRRQINFSAAKFVSDDSQLLTGTPAKDVMLWDSQTGQLLGKWQAQVTKTTKNRGAVVYSVAMTQPDKIISFSSKGLLETFSPK
ncbi:hypothetical protein EXU30_13655 [Shewanella maritima]|uniref:WD40 repeat domain-containing protein n=1 Tax=Shewanella maritima TaxID=2520507 RepID=A0A411PJF1_9GAMM|nr:hypothetical protein [Shewanella maritima]QBF83624.1 hypothetical protein EXU30_13655 [Shewanella maritima]